MPYEVAELAIGHTKKGLQATYDQHEFATEIADAFSKWADHVEALVATAKKSAARPALISRERATGHRLSRLLFLLLATYAASAGYPKQCDCTARVSK